MQRTEPAWRRTALTITLALAMIAASCSTTETGARARELAGLPEPVVVFGMVYDGRNQPVGGAEIFSASGGRVGVSDVTGRFAVRLLPGTHTVRFRRDGFEQLETTIELSTQTQALHVRMTSFAGLLDRAEEAIEDRRWADAGDEIMRAQAVDSRSPVPRYLAAVLAARTDRPGAAVTVLTDLTVDGYNDPYIHLFLADLYQYRLEIPERALEHLREAAERIGTDEITARIRELEGENE